MGHHFLKLINFNWRLITLQHCGGFCHTSTWISHGYTCVPPSWTPATSLSTPSRWVVPEDQLCALLHALNLHWSSVLHMIIYMFQSFSLISSHSHLLPHGPKVCSLHLCLFCFLAYMVIVPIFLNFIYMHLCTVLVFFFLTYFILYNRLQFYATHWNWFKFILLNSWVIFHCVYVPQLSYPFVCQWISRLLPCPSYCKQYCDEHWGTHVSFNSGFLGVYAQQWDSWVIWQFYFQIFKESPHCSP